MNRRLLILPLAAVVILVLVLWRLEQEEVRRNRPRPVAVLRNLKPAPSFMLTTQTGGRAKLAAYLGRTRVVLMFTGGRQGDLKQSAELAAIARAQPEIAGGGSQVVVVTPAPPQEVRQVQTEIGEPFPFPILTDIDPQVGVPTPAHQIWGLVDAPGDPPRPGLFLIDRAGYTEFTTEREGVRAMPRPVADVEATLRKLAAGEWPM